MKKFHLNFLSITVLLFLFQTSKANFHSNEDSSSPRSLYLFDGKSPEPVRSSQKNSLNEKTGKELKKFIFSLVLTPQFETTIPPLNLYFEHGIAGLASAGLTFGVWYDNKPDIDYQAATVSLGLRACGYAFPIISKISGKEINSYGFQPYLGLAFNYYITAVSVADNDINPANYSNVGLIAGTRWYPGKGKFAVLGEVNTNGIGNSIRFGISLGR